MTRTYTVETDGRAVEHCRHVVKILRPQGRDEGLVLIPFDKDAKILSLHVWSIGPDGHQFALKDKEIVEYGYPGEGNFFEDLKAKSANPPGRDPRGLVAYEYEQLSHPYLTEKPGSFRGVFPASTNLSCRQATPMAQSGRTTIRPGELILRSSGGGGR
jgi:hypothetical protein